MKTKLKFLRSLLLVMLLFAGASGALAQTSSTPTQTICIGSQPYLVHPGNKVNTLLWAISPGTSGAEWTITTPTDSTTSVNWLVSGTYTLTLTETTSSGCDSVVSVQVTVSPSPTPTITCHADICQGTAGDIFTTEPGMTNYVWSVSGGGIITGGGTPTSNTVTVTWTLSGSQTVSVNYNDPGGCVGLIPASCTFNVNPTPNTSPIWHN